MSKQAEAKIETPIVEKNEWTEPELKKIDMVETTQGSTGNSPDAPSGSQTIG